MHPIVKKEDKPVEAPKLAKKIQKKALKQKRIENKMMAWEYFSIDTKFEVIYHI